MRRYHSLLEQAESALAAERKSRKEVIEQCARLMDDLKAKEQEYLTEFRNNGLSGVAIESADFIKAFHKAAAEIRALATAEKES